MMFKIISARFKRARSKQIYSMILIFALLICNVLFTLPAAATDPDDSSGLAHSINVFNIDIKQGAEHYAEYVPDDPAPGSPDSLSDVYVWRADNSNDGHKFVYNIIFSVSGEGATDQTGGETETIEAVSPGSIEITVPAHILKYKGDDVIRPDSSGEYPDEAEMPVPNVDLIEHKDVTETDEHGNTVTHTEYATDHQFVYRLDDNGTPDDESDDNYIIYNIKPVSAGVVYEFPIAYRTTSHTWDYQDLGVSEPCHASVTVKSWERDDPDKNEVPITVNTKEIPVYIDTEAHINSTVKRSGETLMSAEEAEGKFGCSGLDPDYMYMIWSVTSDISDVTQKYSLSLTDTPSDMEGTDASGTAHSVPGEFVAAKIGGHLTSVLPATAENLTLSGSRTDYVLTRYRSTGDNSIETLLSAPKDAVYSASNSVNVELIPADGKDANTSKSSESVFRFEVKDPTWVPLVPRYSADKWGLYNNDKHVTSKENVSSYNLADITEDEPVSGLKYKTSDSAYAYANTVSALNDEISSMIVPAQITDGKADIIAGSRKYSFDTEAGTCILTVYNDDLLTTPVEVREIDISDAGELTLLEMQRIAAYDISQNYYGKKPVQYIFDDRTFELADKDVSSESVPLDGDDYRIDSVEYEYTVNAAVYDRENMSYDTGGDNAGLSDNAEYNTLEFYVYTADGGDTPVPAGKYNIATGQASDVNASLVKSLDGEEIVFADGANVTGYMIKTSNDYYHVKLVTYPSVTLKPSDTVRAKVEPIMADDTISEKKVALRNTSEWIVKHADGDLLLDTYKSGTDYIADIIRSSSISKKAFGEKVTVTGNDGKLYKSRNNTLDGHYELVWQTTVSEIAKGIEKDGKVYENYPVEQQSGIFYDLLPAHSDIIEGSVNVYVDADLGPTGSVSKTTPAIPSSSFEILDRIDNYNGSGKKLLVIRINEPCAESYTVTYATVHTHEDIQDYGSYALNTVAYQTGNPDIGNGYPDDGGNYAVSMSNYIKGLDPDNGDAKRFIYAESTEDILALFPTSSGIYKKVATKANPVYSKSGVVHNSENYTYSIRMKNDPITSAKNIAFLDSVENYRTEDGVTYNAGLKSDRDWHGRIVSFDLSGLENKLANYAKTNSEADVSDLKLILYVSDDPETDVVDFESGFSSPSERSKLLANILSGDTEDTNWKVVEDWHNLSGIDMENVTAFIVYMGEHFELGYSDSMSFTVTMRAPDEVIVPDTQDPEDGGFLHRPMTYNNIYRSFYTSPKTPDGSDPVDPTYFYTHYDYTQVQYSTVGNLRFTKADSKTGEPIKDAVFRLSGISDYGTSYNETLVSNNRGVVEFKDLERGTYELTETYVDDDHLLDTSVRTVNVDPRGNVTIVTVDGVVVDDGSGHYTIYNPPRYHADLVFTKVDALSGEGIAGTEFTLEGTSLYGTRYVAEKDSGDDSEDVIVQKAVSSYDGSVVFTNIEKGTYTLTETRPSDGYLPPSVNTYTVTGIGESNMVFIISGEKVVNTGADYEIRNVPTAKMTLQKMDAITKDALNGAEFTLTADSSLNTALANLTSKVSETPWVLSEGSYVQTVSGSNMSTDGGYCFDYLPEGTYTLTETNPPTGYAAKTGTYTIKVVKSSDGKRLVIELPDSADMQYIKIENNEFAAADKETATYYRLTNDQTYEDGKTLVKSWIGGVNGSFPSMHLSTEKPEAKTRKVTINDKLKTIIQDRKSKFTGLEKADSLSQAPSWALNADGSIKDNFDCTTYDIDGEDGHFYVWWEKENSSANSKLYWYSDADIVYLPENCGGLFSGCNNSAFTEFDLSYEATGVTFSGEKVTTMEKMFLSCSKLQNIDLSCIVDTPNLITTQEMFQECTNAAVIELSNWRNAENLENMQSMFSKCSKLSKADFPELVISKLGNCQQMFRDCSILSEVVFGNHITLDKTRHGGSGMGLMSMFINAGKNISNGEMTIDLSGLDTRYIDDGAWGIGHMFNSCSKLKTVYVSEYWDNSKFSTVTNENWAQINIFNGCNNLVGGAGTSFATAQVNKNSHAKVDGGQSDPGYFTYKEAPTPIDLTASTNQNTGADITDITFPDYPHFTKTGDVTQTEDSSATDKDVGETTFTFEYVTANTAVPSDVTEYEVDETVYMTVSRIVEDGGTYYKVSQKYVYDEPVKATWTEVGGNAPTQWKCEMNVQNADDLFYAWEDKVDGYTSTALADNGTSIKTEGRDDKPVITNAKDGTKIYSLELSKTLTGTTSEKFSGDEFWFKVTMNQAGGENYNMLPFENGVAYFKVKPNAEGDDKVIIKGIPEGCTYTVEEVDDAEHPMPAGYTKVTSDPVSGSLASSSQTAVIENSIDTADLTFSKEVELWKKADKSSGFVKVTDSADADLIEWENQEFAFDITLNNLVKGQEYSYKIGGVEQSDKIVGSSESADTVKTITIKGGQNVTLMGIPVGTSYTVSENTSGLEDTDSVTYETTYSKSGISGTGSIVSGELTSENESIAFTNVKKIDLVSVPETVDVTVSKQWFNSDGARVYWSWDDDEIVPPSEGNYPSFLKVYLGRALKIGEGSSVVYANIEPGFTSYSLKAKEDWSYTFRDLPKTGELELNGETGDYPYVYFVTEVVPIGFSNINDESEYTTIRTPNGTEKYLTAVEDGDNYSFALKNKAEPTYELSLTKLVSGNMANRTREFTFEVELFNEDGSPLTGTGLTMQFTDLYDSSYSRSRTYTLEDGMVSIGLRTGRKVTFLSLPEGTKYSIREVSTNGYNVTSGTYTDTADDPDVISSLPIGSEHGTNEPLTLSADSDYLFVNERNVSLPTGIGIALVSPVVLILPVLGILYLLRRSRKRRAEESEA